MGLFSRKPSFEYLEDDQTHHFTAEGFGQSVSKDIEPDKKKAEKIAQEAYKRHLETQAQLAPVDQESEE